MVEGFLWAAKKNPSSKYIENITRLSCCTLVLRRSPSDVVEHFIETGNLCNLADAVGWVGGSGPNNGIAYFK